MKGGNGVREANGITQFAEGEPNVLKRAYPNDAAENLPRMDSAPGVLLDGFAVKESGSLQKSLSQKSPSAPLDRGCLSRQKI